MKYTLLFAISLVFLSSTCMAKNQNEMSYAEISAMSITPFLLVVGLTAYGISKGAISNANNGEFHRNRSPFYYYPFCKKVGEVYIDADETPMFYGKEQEHQSFISKVKDLEPFFDFKKKNSYEPYMCINPKKTRIYENGCLDTLEKDNYKKATGTWHVNRLFRYSNIDYVQFRKDLKNNKFETATVDVKSAFKYAKYNGEFISKYFKRGYYNKANVNISETIDLNCLNNKN